MAGRRNKRPQKKNNARRRGRRTFRSAKQSGLGRIVASGAKSLLASIPVVGTTLSSMADFAFKAFGLTKSMVPEVGANHATSVKQTSLVARFDFSASTILAGSKGCIQLDTGKSIVSPYAEGRIISVTIEVIPIGDFSSRAGDWHIAFQPYFSLDSVHEPGIEQPWLPNEQGIHHMYLSKTGPANRPLSITYRPRPMDGTAYQFNDLGSRYGEVAIRYDKYNRSDYGDFTTVEFCCEVKISGKVETRTTGPSANNSPYGGYVYSSTITDKLKTISMYIMNPERKVENKNVQHPWTAALTEPFKCTDKEGYCDVSGVVSLVRVTPDYPTHTPHYKSSCLIKDLDDLTMS